VTTGSSVSPRLVLILTPYLEKSVRRTLSWAFVGLGINDNAAGVATIVESLAAVSMSSSNLFATNGNDFRPLTHPGTTTVTVCKPYSCLRLMALRRYMGPYIPLEIQLASSLLIFTLTSRSSADRRAVAGIMIAG
jgi:hypothetical protein